MRYGLAIGQKAAVVKAAVDGAYRFVMLGLMIVEVVLLVVLVYLEAVHKGAAR